MFFWSFYAFQVYFYFSFLSFCFYFLFFVLFLLFNLNFISLSFLFMCIFASPLCRFSFKNFQRSSYFVFFFIAYFYAFIFSSYCTNFLKIFQRRLLFDIFLCCLDIGVLFYFISFSIIKFSCLYRVFF